MMNFFTPSKYKLKVFALLLSLVICLDIVNWVISYTVNSHYNSMFWSQQAEMRKILKERIDPVKDKLRPKVQEGELSWSDISRRRIFVKFFLYCFSVLVLSYLTACIIVQIKNKAVLQGSHEDTA